jgi:hypothetical protein
MDKPIRGIQEQSNLRHIRLSGLTTRRGHEKSGVSAVTKFPGLDPHPENIILVQNLSRVHGPEVNNHEPWTTGLAITAPTPEIFKSEPKNVLPS